MQILGKNLNITLNVALDLFLNRIHLEFFRDVTNCSKRKIWCPKAFSKTLILYQTAKETQLLWDEGPS